MMTDYVYIYKNTQGNFNTATNPVFIAQHNYCVAILKTILDNTSIETFADLVYDMSNYTLDKPSEETMSIVNSTELKNIYY